MFYKLFDVGFSEILCLQQFVFLLCMHGTVHALCVMAITHIKFAEYAFKYFVVMCINAGKKLHIYRKRQYLNLHACMHISEILYLQYIQRTMVFYWVT